VPHPYTAADALKWIETCQSAPPGYQLCIELDGDVCENDNASGAATSTPAVAGGIGVSPRCDVQRFTLEIGYWLAVRHWGGGVIARALAAFLPHVWRAAPGAERVEALVYDFNARSTRALERAGFVYEGRLRRAAFKDGAFCDSLVYGLLRGEGPRPGGEAAPADSGAAATDSRREQQQQQQQQQQQLEDGAG
jgi:RimJ/RimL family protein N-acetyltransferase